MVVNVDNFNIPNKIDKNDLELREHILEGICFKIILSGEQTHGKYALLEAYFPQVAKMRYLDIHIVKKL